MTSDEAVLALSMVDTNADLVKTICNIATHDDCRHVLTQLELEWADRLNSYQKYCEGLHLEKGQLQRAVLEIRKTLKHAGLL